MHYTIVSTYPAEGSRNVGDALISTATSEFLAHHDPEATIENIWRAATKEDARKAIHDSDHIVFACLTIRGNMPKVYSFIEDIIESGKPFSIIAAGTALEMSRNMLVQKDFTEEDKRIIRDVAAKAKVFSTRGFLTQRFLEDHNIRSAKYAGDVAFGVSGKKFQKKSNIRKILVSDPHYAGRFLEAFQQLVKGLSDLFPDAEITCARHGVNGNIEETCAALGIPVLPLYEGVDSLRHAYEECDLHVGFRLHGHVTALNCGKPSYLLEQDGRGADYGLSLGLRISTPCFLSTVENISARNVLSKWIKRNSLPRSPLPSAIFSIVSLVDAHAREDFEIFEGMNPVLEDIRRRNHEVFAKICGE